MQYTSANGDILSNVATITSTQVPNGARAAASSVVSNTANLLVSKTTSTPTVLPGGTATYTITITNTGSGNATAVVLQDFLPFSGTSADITKNFTYIASTSVVGGSITSVTPTTLTATVTPYNNNPNQQQITWNFNGTDKTLEAGGVITVTFSTRVGANVPANTYTNDVLVTYNNSSYEVSLLGNVHAVVGKSLLIHRDDLAEIGGLERFAASGGEDFLMAKAIQQIGTIAYSRVASRQVLGEKLSWRSFFERQRRWATLRSHMVPGAFYGLEHFTYFGVPLFFSLFGVIPFSWVAIAFGVKLLLDGALMWAHTDEFPSLVDLAIMPFKEVLLLSAWGFAAFGREVTWRGRLLHLTANGNYEVSQQVDVKAEPATVSRTERL